MRPKIKINLELELYLNIDKDEKDISVLSLLIIKNDLIQRLNDRIRSYKFLEEFGKNYDSAKIELIKTGSVKSTILI